MYAVEVDVFNAVYATDTKKYNLGNYERTDVTKMIYTDGDYCDELGRGRETEVAWTCGDETKITKIKESTTCIYKVWMTKICTPFPGKNQSNRLI